MGTQQTNTYKQLNNGCLENSFVWYTIYKIGYNCAKFHRSNFFWFLSWQGGGGGGGSDDSPYSLVLGPQRYKGHLSPFRVNARDSVCSSLLADGFPCCASQSRMDTSGWGIGRSGGWRQATLFLSLGQPWGVSFPLGFGASVKFSGVGCLCWWLAGVSSGSSAESGGRVFDYGKDFTLLAYNVYIIVLYTKNQITPYAKAQLRI